MCQHTKTAIDVMKSQSAKKTLSRSETIMLFEKVIEDNEKMGERMTSVENRLTDIEKKMDKVLEIVSKPTIGSTIKEVLSNKMFVYLIITLLSAAFGVSVGEVGTFLFK